MFKYIVRGTLVMLAAGFFSSTASAATIDFDTLPGGGVVASGMVISDQYASVGVTFSLFEDNAYEGGAVATTVFAQVGQEGNRLSNMYGSSSVDYHRADILRIDFATPVNDVSFDFLPQGSEGGLTRVLALDSSLTAISDQTTGISGLMPARYTVAGAGISRIEIFQPSEGWHWGLDNLTFTPAPATVPVPVPEPTLMLLAAIGLGVASSRRGIGRRN